MFIPIEYWYCVVVVVVVLWMLGLGKPDESLLAMVELVIVKRGRWLEDAELAVMRFTLGRQLMPLQAMEEEKLVAAVLLLVGGMIPPLFSLSLWPPLPPPSPPSPPPAKLKLLSGKLPLGPEEASKESGMYPLVAIRCATSVPSGKTMTTLVWVSEPLSNPLAESKNSSPANKTGISIKMELVMIKTSMAFSPFILGKILLLVHMCMTKRIMNKNVNHEIDPVVNAKYSFRTQYEGSGSAYKMFLA